MLLELGFMKRAGVKANLLQGSAWDTRLKESEKGVGKALTRPPIHAWSGRLKKEKRGLKYALNPSAD